MQESVKTALAWIRTNAEKVTGRLENSNYLDKFDIHIHFPEASIPKVKNHEYIISVFKLLQNKNLYKFFFF